MNNIPEECPLFFLLDDLFNSQLFKTPLYLQTSGIIRRRGNKTNPRVAGSAADLAAWLVLITDLLVISPFHSATWLPRKRERGGSREAEEIVSNYKRIDVWCRAVKLKNINIVLSTNLVHKLQEAAVLCLGGKSVFEAVSSPEAAFPVNPSACAPICMSA